ncbi:hypothetical protein ACFZCK_32670 [Kitasatospora purpeofusca]|uniref:hypothetical protein n=1 Tax=Kitasatospora purpeofusca TaxID=67352 RepID=UPI0036EA7CB7
MSTEGAPLELAHYYPGWIWDDASVGRMKSLLLYFDGFALLLPEHHFDTTVAREARLAGPLHAAGLLHNLEPDTWLDAENARRIRESADRSLPPSLVLPEDDPEMRAEILYELGVPAYLADPHCGPEDRRAALVDAMLETGAVIRRRPDLGPDMIEMPPQAHSAVLAALGLAAQQHITDHRLHLVGDLPDSGGTTTYALHRDLANVGVDLSPVPLDEILDYRREHGIHYRAYARELRAFVHELEGVGAPADRERLLRDRSESLADQAATLRQARRAWGRPLVSLALGGAGAVWTLRQSDLIGTLLAFSQVASGFAAPAKRNTAFTYLLEARRLR